MSGGAVALLAVVAVGIAGVDTAVPMALVMTLLCLGAVLALATLARPAGAP